MIPIAIAGDLGMGKSTLAKELVPRLDSWSMIVSFADELKKAYADHAWLTIEEVRAKPTPTHIRRGLVDFAAGARFVDKDIWVRKVDELMLGIERDCNHGCPRFICDDVRYHSELSLFRRWGAFAVLLRDMDSRKIISSDQVRHPDFQARFDMIIDLYPETWGEGRPQFADVDEVLAAYNEFARR